MKIKYVSTYQAQEGLNNQEIMENLKKIFESKAEVPQQMDETLKGQGLYRDKAGEQVNASKDTVRNNIRLLISPKEEERSIVTRKLRKSLFSDKVEKNQLSVLTRIMQGLESEDDLLLEKDYNNFILFVIRDSKRCKIFFDRYAQTILEKDLKTEDEQKNFPWNLSKKQFKYLQAALINHLTIDDKKTSHSAKEDEQDNHIENGKQIRAWINKKHRRKISYNDNVIKNILSSAADETEAVTKLHFFLRDKGRRKALIESKSGLIRQAFANKGTDNSILPAVTQALFPPSNQVIERLANNKHWLDLYTQGYSVLQLKKLGGELSSFDNSYEDKTNTLYRKFTRWLNRWWNTKITFTSTHGRTHTATIKNHIKLFNEISSQPVAKQPQTDVMRNRDNSGPESVQVVSSQSTTSDVDSKKSRSKGTTIKLESSNESEGKLSEVLDNQAASSSMNLSGQKADKELSITTPNSANAFDGNTINKNLDKEGEDEQKISPAPFVTILGQAASPPPVFLYESNEALSSTSDITNSTTIKVVNTQLADSSSNVSFDNDKELNNSIINPPNSQQVMDNKDVDSGSFSSDANNKNTIIEPQNNSSNTFNAAEETIPAVKEDEIDSKLDTNIEGDKIFKENAETTPVVNVTQMANSSMSTVRLVDKGLNNQAQSLLNDQQIVNNNEENNSLLLSNSDSKRIASETQNDYRTTIGTTEETISSSSSSIKESQTDAESDTNIGADKSFNKNAEQEDSKRVLGQDSDSAKFVVASEIAESKTPNYTFTSEFGATAEEKLSYPYQNNGSQVIDVQKGQRNSSQTSQNDIHTLDVSLTTINTKRTAASNLDGSLLFHTIENYDSPTGGKKQFQGSPDNSPILMKSNSRLNQSENISIFNLPGDEKYLSDNDGALPSVDDSTNTDSLVSFDKSIRVENDTLPSVNGSTAEDAILVSFDKSTILGNNTLPSVGNSTRQDNVSQAAGNLTLPSVNESATADSLISFDKSTMVGNDSLISVDNSAHQGNISLSDMGDTPFHADDPTSKIPNSYNDITNSLISAKESKNKEASPSPNITNVSLPEFEQSYFNADNSRNENDPAQQLDDSGELPSFRSNNGSLAESDQSLPGLNDSREVHAFTSAPKLG